MNKCVICGKECKGVTCSAKCRKTKSRRDTKCDISGCDTPSVTKCDIVLDERDSGDWPQILNRLPIGVVRPTGYLNDHLTQVMPYTELARRINSYSGIKWVGSPEYAEVIFRLLNLTVEQLKSVGQFIPVWKEVA